MKLLLTLLCLMLAWTAWGADWYVGTTANLTNAVASASSNDTVFVSNGTYVVNLSVGAGVTVRSISGLPADVILDGNAAGRVVLMEPSSRLIGCTVTNGLVTSDTGGGIAGGIVSNCLVVGNGQTGVSGGGGGAYNSTLFNCLIINNSVGAEVTGGGGALSCVLNNCTLSGNASFAGGGGADSCTLNNSISWSNSPADATCTYSYSCGESASGTGCITNNPLFVSTSDFRLQAESPCRDVGNNSAWVGLGVSKDLDGLARIRNGVVDIGAYEYLYGDTGLPIILNISGSRIMIYTAPAHVLKTGQTISYATGDDGEYEAGATLPVPRFTVQVDTNCVTDNLTGLIWARNANLGGNTAWSVGGTCTLANAYNIITNASGPVNGASYGGYTDWRMPNRLELVSLADEGNASPALPTGHPFANVKLAKYWSSTPTDGASTEWHVNFVNGLTTKETPLTNVNYVLPVRGESTVIPKTGQTTSYRTGDDGDLEKGVAWPSPRFTAQANTNCIRDNLTGLIWAQNAGLWTQTNWGAALTNCNNLDFGDQTDWRLPTKTEFQSLIDNSFPDGGKALPAGHPFGNVLGYAPRYYYWTSTADPAITSAHFAQTPVNANANASAGYFAWPVRGPDLTTFSGYTLGGTGANTLRGQLK
jgi:hypothetical protein